MELSEAKLREYSRRIMTARMRLLCTNGFYGLLLMHLKMNIGTEHETAWTDGKRGIYFHPAFLDRVSDRELDYALMHILMHLALDHLGRKGNVKDECHDLASDIIVNSSILRSFGGEEDYISLRGFGGVQPHLAPNGEEGWKYTLEELYEMLLASAAGGGKNRKKSNVGSNGKSDVGSDGQEGADGEGTEESDGTDDGNGEGDGSDDGSGDDGTGKGHGTGRGKQGRGKVSNSGKRGNASWDSHEAAKAGDGAQDASDEAQMLILKQEWQGWVLQAAGAMRIRENCKTRGLMPAFVERYLEDLSKPKLDWRTILQEFVQEEVNDYSLCPPDRRFEDSPFFLPDFNEKDFRVEKILFMIDTSGSMSDGAVRDCYSEIKGAIDQFNGKLEGWLGFFDAAVTEPEAFMDEEEFMVIRPKGGGGTSFKIIFQYVAKYMTDDLPVSIVILTDGYAPFPKESDAMDIPVLWIITNEEVTPPWGRVARMNEAEE